MSEPLTGSFMIASHRGLADMTDLGILTIELGLFRTRDAHVGARTPFPVTSTDRRPGYYKVMSRNEHSYEIDCVFDES